MTGKFHLTRWGIISLALVVALATIGVSYAQWAGQGKGKGPGSNPVETDSCDTEFIWVVSNDNGTPEDYGGFTPIDLGDNGLDPSAPQAMGIECDRYDENVARTTALIDESNNHSIGVLIENAYPCYYSTVFFGIKNSGTLPAKIVSIIIDEDATTPEPDIIPELTVTYDQDAIYIGQEIPVGEEVAGALYIHVEGEALQNATYKIRLVVEFECQAIRVCGTAYANGDDYAECFLDMDIIDTKRWGWTNGLLSSGSTYTFLMYAGAGGCDITTGTVVGTVTVVYDGSTAIVTYDMYEGYTMDVTHLYVGNEPLPKKNGKPTVAPGQYPDTHDLQDAITDDYTINNLSGKIYVIAHAVVCW